MKKWLKFKIKKILNLIKKIFRFFVNVEPQVKSAKELFKFQVDTDIANFKKRLESWGTYPEWTIIYIIFWGLFALTFFKYFLYFVLILLYRILCLYFFLFLDIIIIDKILFWCPRCQLVYRYFRIVLFLFCINFDLLIYQMRMIDFVTQCQKRHEQIV